MERRTFLAHGGAAGIVSTGVIADTEYTVTQNSRDYLELRRYTFATTEKKKTFDTFMADTAIPAMNRIGIDPVGVFYMQDEYSPVYVLRRFKTLESFVESKQWLLSDKVFLNNGAGFLDVTAENPVYTRVESSLMVAFTAIPNIETPVHSKDRIFQLRIYESPSEKTGLKKIEMFNTAEIAIFRNTGLNPVFFGETLVGDKMPNLTYMLGFESTQEQSESWKRFGSHPDWQKLKAIPEYADSRILCGITNLSLIPAPYSQI